MKLVYICAPYAAYGDVTVEENIRRACLLAKHAVNCGLAPVVVHPSIAAGVYGEDSSAADRARGLACAKEIARGVAKVDGLLWILLRDGRTLSAGCSAEVAAFKKTRARDGVLPTDSVAFTWADWCVRLRVAFPASADPQLPLPLPQPDTLKAPTAGD